MTLGESFLGFNIKWKMDYKFWGQRLELWSVVRVPHVAIHFKITFVILITEIEINTLKKLLVKFLMYCIPNCNKI